MYFENFTTKRRGSLGVFVVRSRVVGVKGIMTIKNVEESSDKHEYKSRIVATGNFVRDRYLHKVPDWSMWSPTTSMQGMRFVCA